MNKQSLIQVVNELPQEFNLDELMEKLLVIEKIDAGLNDVRKGRTVSHEKVKKEVKKWAR